MTMIEFTCLKSTIKMGVIQPVRKRKRRTKERHGSGSAIYPSTQERRNTLWNESSGIIYRKENSTQSRRIVRFGRLKNWLKQKKEDRYYHFWFLSSVKGKEGNEELSHLYKGREVPWNEINLGDFSYISIFFFSLTEI